jgi:hypothetical protein
MDGMDSQITASWAHVPGAYMQAARSGTKPINLEKASEFRWRSGIAVYLFSSGMSTTVVFPYCFCDTAVSKSLLVR